MGWTETHLHLFHLPDGSVYTDPEFMLEDVAFEDEAKVKLRRIAKDKGVSFKYEYDFGDDWVHTIEVEEILPDAAGREPRCLAGEGAGPPEDVGGVHGYLEFLEAMADPRHERHTEMKEWVDDTWFPEFDVGWTNEALRAIK